MIFIIGLMIKESMRDLKSFSVYDAPDVNLKRTGKILKHLREENKLSVRELRDFFGFDYPNAIYDWEKGLKLPNLTNLIALSKLYEVSIDELLLSDEQEFPVLWGYTTSLQQFYVNVV